MSSEVPAAITMSGIPSWLRSPVATPQGVPPSSIGRVATKPPRVVCAFANASGSNARVRAKRTRWERCDICGPLVDKCQNRARAEIGKFRELGKDLTPVLGCGKIVGVLALV